MESTAILNEVKEILVVDLLHHGLLINEKFSHAFVDPEPGIYILSNNTPAIRQGQKVYSRQSFRDKKPLEALDGVVSDILDETGAVIIPAWVMQKPGKFISTKPHRPVRAMDVLEIVIQEFIDSHLLYTEAQDFNEKAKPYIKEEFFNLLENGYIESACRDVLREISFFINADNWSLYFTQRQGTDLIITKGADWRVYDWTRQKENTEQEEKDRKDRGE